MSNNALDHDFASKFDYVMVFPKDKDGDNYSQTVKSKAIIDLMIRRGFEIFAYDSVQGDELIVLLRCDEEVLKTFTDVIDYELELDPIKAEEFMTKGNPEKCISPVHINPDPAYSRFTPYQYIYGKYDGKIDPALYRKHPSQQNAQFKESIRLKMVYYMLEAATRFGGCNISFSDLFRNNDLLALYPMHHLVYGNILLKQMVSRETYPWTIPHDALKEYFGEKVALYYCFLGNYTKMLIYPSIVGFICQMVVWGTGNTSSPVLPFFAIFVCLWAIAMLEYWKREEQLTAMRWGMLNYENQEPDRPEFEGTLISSYIDGQPMMFFPKHDARKRNRYSVAIVCSMVLMVIGVVTSIYVIRFALQSSSVAPYSSLVASVLNTIQITIFNIIYNKVATKLTDYENHRTDTNYEDSMIVKLFAFQFVNSYASFFFLAFIAAHLNKPPSDDDSAADNVGQCGAETCMTPLATNLAIIFGTKITVNSCLEVILPYKAYKDKLKAETEGTTKTLSRPEKDYMLLPYDIMAESIKDYADTAIQFGFMTLFITALPIACLFSLLSCIIKVKVNGWKMLTFYQRPVPIGAQDIGSWQVIFSLVSVVSVVTNAAIVCFTMNVLDGYSYLGRTWLFIGFQWFLISVQFIISAAIPDTPESVHIQQKRAEFIVSKLILHVEDEDYGEEQEDPNGRQSVIDSANPLLAAQAKHGHDDKVYPEVHVRAFPHSKPKDGWPSVIKREKV